MSARLSLNRQKAYSLLLLNSILWGFSPPIIKHSLNFINPTVFLFYRYLIASFAFFPIFLFYKAKYRPHPNLPRHLFLALLGTPLTLLPLFYGLAASTSIESSILQATNPIFVLVGSLVYLHEKINKNEKVGAILAILGTSLLVFYPLLFTKSNLSFTASGNILIILSNIIWASFLILSKKNHIDPIYLSFLSFIVSLPFFLGLAIFNHLPLNLPAESSFGVFYMGLCGSIIAFWAYQQGQKLIEASEAVIFTYLQPVFGIPLAFLWLHENLKLATFISLALIVLGVYISEKR